ncbi:MAG TPA: DUF2469 family protein [Actinomycetota bacterium]|nr:DUF2469 family protein [Actinomycetota bacterium]
MSAEDLEQFETDLELALYREYRDVLPMFRYVVETDRRSYLCNSYEMKAHPSASGTWFELVLKDAWAWDIYRPTRFVQEVKIHTVRDLNIEELARPVDRSPNMGDLQDL